LVTRRDTITRRLLVSFLALLFLPALPLPAQISPPTIPDNDLTPVSPLGIPPAASTEGTNESVTPLNGAVNLYIPLLSLPQRGGYPLYLGYVHHSNLNAFLQTISVQAAIGQQNTDVDTIHYTDYVTATDTPLEINLPRLQASNEYVGDHQVITSGVLTRVSPIACQTNFTFTDWSGNKHPFENITNCTSQYQRFVLQNVTESSDGSFYELNTTNLADMQVLAKDGTVYHFSGNYDVCPGRSQTTDCGANFGENFYDSRASSVVDPNGNKISITTSGPNADSLTYAVTDTVGRIVTITPTSVMYLDSNGNNQTITSTSSTATAPAAISKSMNCQYIGPPQSAPYVNPTVTGVPINGANVETTTEIVFPESSGGGQKTYSVVFDPLNRLSKIVYPVGGYTRYDYDDADNNALTQQTNTQCTYSLGEVAHKYECSSSSGSCSSEQTTTYTPTVFTNTTGSHLFNSSMLITYPASVGYKELHIFSTSTAPRTNPQELSVQTYNASGSIIRTVQKAYQPITQPNTNYNFDFVFPSSVTTTLSDASPSISSVVTYTYEPYMANIGSGTESVFLDNPTEIDTADFNGTVKRKVTQVWNPASAFSSTSHILDRLQSSTVNDPIYGNQSVTTYGYDTSGNITSVVKSGTNASSATYQYPRDSYGDIAQVHDPLEVSGAHTGYTTVQYTEPNLTGCPTGSAGIGLPTIITDALGHTQKIAYWKSTGLVACTQDQNGQITKADYDAVGHVTSVTYPDSGVVTTSNYDGAPSTISTTNQIGVSSITTLDGYGRVAQTELTTDPFGPDYVEKTYDVLGRLASVSNPFRTTTQGTTTYAYDALSRKTLECNPDNGTTGVCTAGTSYKQWIYSNATTDIYDEARNHSQQTTDALGRLVKVLEPNSSNNPTLETDYAYDAWSNLKQVDQWGGANGASGERQRLFNYDGLSRLLSSTNPESGQSSYAYDLNGNVTTKTLPAPNAGAGSTATVVGAFTYDALNRLTSKSFTTNYATSRISCFQYDQSSVTGAQGGFVGRMTNEWTQSASCPSNGSGPSAGFLTLRSILNYDTMGRITSERECTPENCSLAAPQQFNMTYGYDLASHQTMYSNGIGTISISSAYNTANWLQTVTATTLWDDQQHPGTLFSPNPSLPQYSPAGLLTNALYGPSLSIQRTYDNRFRVTSEVDTGQQTQNP
jgi:YD repeat-containing protein